MGRNIWAAALLVLALAWPASAANRYVREGATGTADGSDWTNAYTALPATLTRGDTYYIADGSYAAYTFDDAVSSTTLITIRKATASSHGTDTGWVWTYGDGTAAWALVTFDTSYWVFDGVTGGGPGAWQTGHGFTFSATAGTSIAFVTLTSGVSNITVRHASFTQTGDTEATTIGAHGFYNLDILNASTFEYLHFDNLGGLPFLLRNGSGNVIQYVYSGNICGQSVADINEHCEAVVIHNMDDIHFRWNWITESPSSGGFVKNGTDIADDVRIYGNVIGDGVAVVCNSGPCTDWRVFNNTFVNLTTGPISGNGTLTGGLTYNNIIFDGVATTLLGTHDYNWWSQIDSHSCFMDVGANENVTLNWPGDCDVAATATDPFVAYGSGDYRLAAAISGQSGTDSCALSASCSATLAYDVDWWGRTRGADGTWDRGALEFSATAPAKPTGVRE
jgi:hypothetical protein